MSKGYISNGLAIIGAITTALIANTQHEIGKVNYKEDCKTDYIETTITNKKIYNLPNELTTLNNCKFKVTFNNNSRMEYFALNKNQRKEFSIRGRIKGEYLTVYEVFKKDEANMRSITVNLSKDKLHTTGSKPECFVDNMRELCFKSEKEIHPTFKHQSHVYKVTITVDTAGYIYDLKSHGRQL